MNLQLELYVIEKRKFEKIFLIDHHKKKLHPKRYEDERLMIFKRVFSTRSALISRILDSDKGIGQSSIQILRWHRCTQKALLAKAVATNCGVNFFSVKGLELLNMYIGESEANARRVFKRARGARPCVIFFDKLDIVAPQRGNQELYHLVELLGLLNLFNKEEVLGSSTLSSKVDVLREPRELYLLVELLGLLPGLYSNGLYSTVESLGLVEVRREPRELYLLADSDSGGVMDRSVSQLLTKLDGISNSKNSPTSINSSNHQGKVIIIEAKKSPDLLVPALLRPGRFDKMIYLGIVETREEKYQIRKSLTNQSKKQSTKEEAELEIWKGAMRTREGGCLYVDQKEQLTRAKWIMRIRPRKWINTGKGPGCMSRRHGLDDHTVGYEGDGVMESIEEYHFDDRCDGGGGTVPAVQQQRAEQDSVSCLMGFEILEDKDEALYGPFEN
ncbi:P-loop containing nucleoside triphosphate hydrolase protein [Phakopsora pachyrhizi]|uniref:P-loop containing nucleoside triphosphate hydrolase protein n=1 Tax=Phakopsora pachyrhizi TaxID=170000 RepID=A0AAV0AP63_PHAPC|nr:P-loop containing nucleoside triphosphate hydrolase protein [Phakopsora pachyrhizi]